MIGCRYLRSLPSLVLALLPAGGGAQAQEAGSLWQPVRASDLTAQSTGQRVLLGASPNAAPGPGRFQCAPRSDADGGHGSRGGRRSRSRAAAARGRLRALPDRGLADHGGRAGGRVPRAAHLQGPGHRRPDRHAALRLDPDGFHAMVLSARHALHRPAQGDTRTTSRTTRRTTGAGSTTSAARSRGRRSTRRRHREDAAGIRRAVGRLPAAAADLPPGPRRHGEYTAFHGGTVPPRAWRPR